MNRFPHASHSPTSMPSSPVENRRGAPHFRHGRPRGIPPSSRSGCSRSLSGLADSRFGTKMVVVSQSAQTASIDPPLPSRNDSGDPHSSHSGPPSVPSPADGPSPEGAAGPAGGVPRRDETVVPSTNANSFAHEGQVPVRRRTSRCSKSIEVPHSGQELVMVVQRRNSLTPHYVPLPMFVGKSRPRRGHSEGTESCVSWTPSPTAGAERDSRPAEAGSFGRP